MDLPEKYSRFCIFCYRSDNQSITALQDIKDFSLFLKVLGRFNGDRDNRLEKQMESIQLDKLPLSEVLGCCEGCLVTVNKFCEIYHQFKLLEMKLEWKTEKLVSIIKLANRVPSRVSQVNKVLQMEQADEDGGNGRLKVVRTFRHSFTKLCRRRLRKCQPRVLLSRPLADSTPKAKDKTTLKQPSFEDPIPDADTQLIRGAGKTTAKIVDQDVHLDRVQTKSEIGVSMDPKPTNESNGNDIGQDDVTNDQNTESEDAMENNDSMSCGDCDDDPLNCDDFCEEDTPKLNGIASVENVNNFTIPPIPTKQEFPIPEENVTLVATQPIPEPPSSLIIEDVFSRLPLSLNKLLSKNLLCTICKRHFKSQDSLSKHIKTTHSKPSSKIQKTDGIKTETGTQNNDASLIKTCTKATTPSQQRYSLRQRKSLNLAEVNNDNDNDRDYTAEKNYSSSNTSDSEEDSIKPIKLSKTIKLENPKKNIEYTNCPICNKKTSKNMLEPHLKTWHDKTGLAADNQIKNCTNRGCLAYFLTQKQLRFHLRNEHNTKFRCHMCQKTFPIQLLLNRHLRQAHGRTRKNPLKCLEERKFKSKEFKCNFCAFITTSPTKLAIHETDHALPLPDDDDQSNLKCPRCPYKYAKRMQRRYVVHHLRHHLSYLNGDSSGACEMCSKGKSYVENTKQHFDNHHNTDLLEDPTNIFKCDECPSYYLKSFQLHRHKIRIHPSKTCEICGTTFKSRHVLLGHMKRIHKDHHQNPALPVPCDWPKCVKRFGTEAELEFHKIYSHKRNPEGKKGSEICEKCGKGFRSAGLLKVHMKKIHVEKNWVCSECGKSFTRKAAFETHMEYHKGPESWKFECKECGKKCMDKYKLASHMNTHTKEKPWICQFCGEKYAHRHNWRNHLKGRHMDEEGVEEIVNSKKSQSKGNYLSRKGTKKGDCIMAPTGK